MYIYICIYIYTYRCVYCKNIQKKENTHLHLDRCHSGGDILTAHPLAPAPVQNAQSMTKSVDPYSEKVT